jgi:hypothetical protein
MIGSWQFNNSLANDVSGGSSASLSGSFSPGNYVSTMINGEIATALQFPRSLGFTNRLGIPNDTGADMPVFSIVADFRLRISATYSGFLNLDRPTEGGYGDYFIHANGTIFGGQNINPGYNFVISNPGVIQTNTWHRVGLTNDANNNTKIYVDGTLVASGTKPPSYFRGGPILSTGCWLFTDDANETSPGDVNSVALFNSVLSENDMARFGGASASGITAVPEPSSLYLWFAAVGFARVFSLGRKRHVACQSIS